MAVLSELSRQGDLPRLRPMGQSPAAHLRTLCIWVFPAPFLAPFLAPREVFPLLAPRMGMTRGVARVLSSTARHALDLHGTGIRPRREADQTCIGPLGTGKRLPCSSTWEGRLDGRDAESASDSHQNNISKTVYEIFQRVVKAPEK